MLVVVYHLWPVGAAGRLRRRRRVLRHLRLPDHVAAAARGRAARDAVARRLLGAARAADPARGAASRCCSARWRRCVLVPLDYWQQFFARHPGQHALRRRTGISRAPRSTTSPPTTPPPRSSTSGRCRSRSSSTSCGRCCCVLAAAGARRRAGDRRGDGGRHGASASAYSLYYTAADPAAAYFVTPDAGVGVRRRRRCWRCCPTCAAHRAPAPRSPGPGWRAIVADALCSTATARRSRASRRRCRCSAPWPSCAPDAAAALGPGRLYALRPVQFVGDISYSVYLWHWPLIVLAPIVLARDLNTPIRICILVLTLLLAWLSKLAVEDPLRRGRGDKRTFAYAALGTGVVLARQRRGRRITCTPRCARRRRRRGGSWPPPPSASAPRRATRATRARTRSCGCPSCPARSRPRPSRTRPAASSSTSRARTCASSACRRTRRRRPSR